MGTHRFREHLRSMAGSDCPFVLFPLGHALSSPQQAQIQEVYRLAAEHTFKQLRQQRSRRPSFSWN